MTVAELFVNIGIKGGEEAKSTFEGLNKGLKGLWNSSMSTKAAMIGAVYGLHQFMTSAATSGMELKQFSNLTGQSTEELQRWQYAARQSGVEAEEVSSSVVNLQSSIAKMKLGIGGPPGGLAMLSKINGGLDYSQLDKPFYVLKELQKFAQNKAVPTATSNEIMKMMGVSDKMIQFLRANKLDVTNVGPAEIYSKREIEALAKMDVAWANFYRHMRMFRDHLVAKHGTTIMGSIIGATKGFDKFVATVERLGNVGTAIKMIVGALALIAGFTFAPITASLFALTVALDDFGKGKLGYIGKATDFIAGKWKDFRESEMGKSLSDLLPGALDANKAAEIYRNKTSPIPSKAPQGSGPIVNKTMNVNVTHYGDARDTKAVKDLHKSAIQTYTHFNMSTDE